jgi:UDPglucose 6-dehydrogenase
VGEVNAARVETLRQGKVPIYEQGLNGLIARGVEHELLTFHTSNPEAVAGAGFVFLTLPTPPAADGRADTSFVDAVIDEIGPLLDEGAIIVVKSTVPVGTATRLRKRLADIGSRAISVSNPEFLREGKAVEDFLKPDRIVIGAFDPADGLRLASLYAGLEAPFVHTDPTSAEMIKYAANSYLATRLTFANTLSNLCEAVGADVRDVIKGIGYDFRIGPHFLNPGPGYGGSCFPKDTVALIATAEESGYDFQLLKAVIRADEEQRWRVVEKVRRAVGGDLRKKTVALWGLAFKAGTDDVRESPAVRIADLLKAAGAKVVAYDPEASLEWLTLASSPVEAARGADVVLLATDWPEFIRVDLRQVASVMRGRRLIDARNLLDPPLVRAAGLEYEGLGRPTA